jgi:hypothetical protein
MKDPIARGYLSKPGMKLRTVRLVDVMTLVHNVMAGAMDESVGFEDAGRTINDVLRRLNRNILMDPSVLESALWSCNLMNEKGQFWDSRGRSFDELLLAVLKGDPFNKTYNLIETPGKDSL